MPAGTPDRPPTILSESGEGYCRTCRFVEGLGPDGLLLRHDRAPEPGAPRWPCPGTGTRPAKVTPYASRLSAFASSAKRYGCPECGQKVPIRALDGRFSVHAARPGGIFCPGGYKFPPGRDHGNGRG